MDTGSHLLCGVTLAGLAHLDPFVANHPGFATVLMIGTIMGSHAPDFDMAARIKGFAAYIRYHRGVTHSFPALFAWPLLIAVVLAKGFGVEEQWMTLYLWTFAAVVIHVGLDMLNSYGVQCFRPFSRKWIHLDILAIFEPVLFLLHAGGLIFWLSLHYSPAPIFVGVYAASFSYIGLRAWHHALVLQKVAACLAITGIIQVLPTFSWFHWRFVLETEACFYTGQVVHGRVTLEDVYSKQKRNAVIQATLGTDGVRAFLGFAQRIHVTCRELQDGYEVRWSDVRFWYKRKLPFGVDVKLDRNMRVIKHTLGWRKKVWDPPFV
ncbi:metal-dependent hydrolase [Aneurinibacillus sp. Ricciae_BoGa-3]|uniref:metal-dependent hydrolase n=1 Tax=Aneurinibacillus sp. Ricciae_BoGa-3 TaxID=3022697 RepID=UPI002341D3A7|nr:metal-dependent hydrolase [Aneurinibacillus sp. Ricciae_BoGa-3]WCK54878.1 metal-dependent hydrolase [Aneurinibacillus sp. Ricciae_BoGa-3]